MQFEIATPGDPNLTNIIKQILIFTWLIQVDHRLYHQARLVPAHIFHFYSRIHEAFADSINANNPYINAIDLKRKYATFRRPLSSVYFEKG